jgi:hypothetical protein
MSRIQWSRAVRWPLWSWRNLTITAIAVLLVLAALGRITGSQDPSATPTEAAAAPVTASAPAPSVSETFAPTTTATATATSVPTETAAPAPADSSGSPVTAASAFVTAWTHTTSGDAAWLAGMKPWATQSLLASLDGTDPSQVPASRVTGDAALVKTTGSTATVSVPTDGGRVAITMVSQSSSWKANGLAPDGAPPAAPTPSLEPSQPAAGN